MCAFHVYTFAILLILWACNVQCYLRSHSRLLVPLLHLRLQAGHFKIEINIFIWTDFNLNTIVFLTDCRVGLDGWVVHFEIYLRYYWGGGDLKSQIRVKNSESISGRPLPILINCVIFWDAFVIDGYGLLSNSQKWLGCVQPVGISPPANVT